MRPQAARRRPRPKFTSLELGRKHRPDYWLLMLCVTLLAIGLIVVYAISPALGAANHASGGHYVTKQMLAIALSAVAFMVTYKLPLEWWRHMYKPLLIAAAVATALAIVLPVNPAYPAHRWVRLGGLSFQSVELVKFAVLIWLSGFLAERMRQGTIRNFSATLKPILIALAVIGGAVLVAQSDTGSFGLIIVMMAIMTYVAGLPLGRIVGVGAVVLVALILIVSATPYRRERLATFLHPQSNCQSSGYQACQALIAVGSGGMIGLGLGSSVQAYGYLPEAANDSIFAIYAEKFGFIGSILLLAVFVSLFARLRQIVERSGDDFSRLLVVGVLAWFSTQTLINIGAMIGLLPLKGITLPFISYGGTSVVFMTAAIGLVFQISQYTSHSLPRADASREDRGLRRPPERPGLRRVSRTSYS